MDTGTRGVVLGFGVGFVGVTLWVHRGLLVGSALFVVSDYCPPLPNPTVFYVILVAGLFYAVCALVVSRTSPGAIAPARKARWSTEMV